MGHPRIQNPAELRRCLGGDYENHRYLRNSTERDIGRMNKVFGDAAQYNRNIVEYAERLAHEIEVTDPNGFMSLVEVVAAAVKEGEEEKGPHPKVAM
ncbi:hypothetical protein TELCIR_10407 [Teladorsagia circumcincta]|uniref:Uncharacterized protein n=1 Tax=Teladorsagia circumcincta TaxID=45464 RepID=A0A2G9UC82_TELCI|nr:hypothetical protein TELCIR_10407 [Teladorsagia circumcincta]